MLAGGRVVAQDFSNKGKDFWVAYGFHGAMLENNNAQDMVLYIATEAVTTVTVSIPGIGYSQTYNNIPANTVFTSNPIPKVAGQDARLTTETTVPVNKGIHITANQPVVAYAHIYNQNVSGATILFPTATLGKEYYSVNFTNISNSKSSNSWFYVVACDTGTTTVEITPSAKTINHAAGVPFTVSLTQGQVFNLMGEFLGSTSTTFSYVDLTGSVIRSISSGSGGCKRIAVFSGSGRIAISCNGTAPSSDNYMVQALPKSAWGKKYLATATAFYGANGGNGLPLTNNIYRICISKPGTNVTLNNIPIALPLQNNFYYEVPATNQPLKIEADQPIMVAQYLPSQDGCGADTTYGDPETIYLSSVEQSISKVTWNACHNYNISAKKNWVNVIIPNRGTAISSFKLDGATVAPSRFTVHPQDANYSYAIINVAGASSGAGINHTIQSDSGFNAIAYGYGNYESYGYNAGTNVKDLYQFVSIANEYATVDFPATCRNTPFLFSMTFPYQPLQIRWDFGGIFANDTIYSPVYDSTWIVNGRQLYRYKLSKSYSITNSGTYPIKVFAQNPTAEGCSGEQEINYELKVYDPPKADFNFATTGCVTDEVSFSDNSNPNGRSNIKWNWDFGDAGTNNLKDTKHKYSLPGTYNVRYSVITDVGCISDTASKTTIVVDPPVAKFSVSTPNCTGKALTFTDNSIANSGATFSKWYWDFGDGSPQIIATSNATQSHIFTTEGTNNVSLKVEVNTGCQSAPFVLPVAIHPNPKVNFSFPNICLPVGAAQFTDLSTIADGSQNQFSYSWDFGDAGPGSFIKNPLHNFTTTGPYNVSLTVTSNNGCISDTTISVNTIYPEPTASFTAPLEICLDGIANFKDQSSAISSSITQWNWDFGDGTSSNLQNPAKTYSNAGTYSVKLSVTNAIGCQTINKISTKDIIINPLPTPDFSFSSPACENGNVLISDNSVANAGILDQWNWNFGDGQTSLSTSATPFNHFYNSAGAYNVTLQIKTDKGCTGSLLTKQLVIHPNPMAGFVSPQVCLNDPAAPFIDTSHISSGAITSWNWDFGDGGSSTIQNPSHVYPSIGNYTGRLIVTSDRGCKDTISQSFTVNGSLPVASFSVQNSNSLCSNQSVNLVDASSVDFGSLIRLEIYWDYGNDPTIQTIDLTPVKGKIYSHTYPEFTVPNSKTYRIQYVAYSGISCVNTFTRTITLLATPELQFDPINKVCSNDPSFQINQEQLLNGLPGSGIFSGPGVSGSGMFDPKIAGAGLQTIRFTYNASNGCSNYKEQTIQVNPTPLADAGPDKVVLEGGFVTLTPALISGIPVSYLWTPSIGLQDPNIAAAVASPTEDITYTLTVTSDQGCTTSDMVFVEVLKKPNIPNIFSPNGDGVHDRWEIKYLDSYPGCTVDVYNRYGQLIYHTVGYGTPWDGTINGKSVPVGTYYYIVDPKNGRSKMSGYVDVIR